MGLFMHRHYQIPVVKFDEGRFGSYVLRGHKQISFVFVEAAEKEVRKRPRA